MGQRLRIEPSRFRRVDLITAGENQVVVCAPIVYLEATVSGEIEDHAYEWVQLTGTPLVDLLPVPGFPNRTYYAAGPTVVGSSSMTSPSSRRLAPTSNPWTSVTGSTK